jgi:hypothetical protein
MRGSRTVCLPDFQGLGLGNALFSTLAGMWSGLGYRVFSGTAHPAEINKRVSSGQWKLKNQGRTPKEKPTTLIKARFARSRAAGRLISTFEYTGPPMEKLEAQKLYARGAD